MTKRVSKLSNAIRLAMGFAIAAFAGLCVFRQGASVAFDQTHPGFEEKNRRMIWMLLRRPKNRLRDMRIQMALENLRWADECRRTGLDPEIAESIRYQNSLLGP